MKKLIIGLLSLLFMVACTLPANDATSNSGVEKVNVQVQTQPSGMTVEQAAIVERYKRDNAPGSIKHLYVFSTESGQLLLYSTVKGKVTSSGKRLTPSTVNGNGYESAGNDNFVDINGAKYITDEILGDDGTYGSSIEYLYWFDSKGVYHQHYRGGNEMLHISDQPLAVESILLNLEVR